MLWHFETCSIPIFFVIFLLLCGNILGGKKHSVWIEYITNLFKVRIKKNTHVVTGPAGTWVWSVLLILLQNSGRCEGTAWHVSPNPTSHVVFGDPYHTHMGSQLAFGEWPTKCCHSHLSNSKKHGTQVLT